DSKADFCAPCAARAAENRLVISPNDHVNESEESMNRTIILCSALALCLVSACGGHDDENAASGTPFPLPPCPYGDLIAARSQGGRAGIGGSPGTYAAGGSAEGSAAAPSSDSNGGAAGGTPIGGEAASGGVTGSAGEPGGTAVGGDPGDGGARGGQA